MVHISQEQQALRTMWHSVECIPGCANCYPVTCPLLTDDNLCSVHPAALGISDQEAELLGRGMGCSKPPIELFSYGHFCPAVVQVLEEQFGIDVPHHTGSDGREYMDDVLGTLNATRVVRGLNP